MLEKSLYFTLTFSDLVEFVYWKYFFFLQSVVKESHDVLIPHPQL